MDKNMDDDDFDLKDIIRDGLNTFLAGVDGEATQAALDWFGQKLNFILREKVPELDIPGWITFTVVDNGVIEVGFLDPAESAAKLADMKEPLGEMLRSLQVDPRIGEPLTSDEAQAWVGHKIPMPTDMNAMPCVLAGAGMGVCGGVVKSFRKPREKEGEYDAYLRLCEQHEAALGEEFGVHEVEGLPE